MPVTQVALSFDAGDAADAPTARGLAALTHEPARRRHDQSLTSQQIAEAEERLGADDQHRQLGSTARTSTLSALSPNLAPSLDLLADIVQQPGLRAGRDRPRARPDADRHRAAAEGPDAGRAARCCRRCSTAPTIPMAAPPAAIRRRSRSSPATTGRLPAALAAARQRQDLRRLRPAAERGAAAARQRSSATGRAPAAAKGVKTFTAPPARPAAPKIVLVDRPGAPQSTHPRRPAAAGRPAAATSSRSTAANDVLGGNFLSRLNMDLRETKGWSYGVSGNVRAAANMPCPTSSRRRSRPTGPAMRSPRSTRRSATSSATKGVTARGADADDRQQHQRACRASSRPRARCSAR